MTPADFKKLFALAPDRYPTNLESQYPRILAQILEKWDSPKALQNYLNDLVVDVRGDRQGFPTEVMAELLFISAIYHRWLNDRRRRADPKRLEELSSNLVFELENNQRKMSPELSKVLQQVAMLLMRNDTKALDLLHEHHIDVNQKDVDGMTPLMHASGAGSEQCVLGLIKLNANPHMVDTTGNTALHWAVVKNKMRIIEILLYFGADPNQKNKTGASSFMLSAIKADSAIAWRLLDYGASATEPDPKGNTPLHRAVSARSKEGIWMLLHAGANKDTKNKEGESAAMLASKSPEVANVFEQFRADLMRQHAK